MSMYIRVKRQKTTVFLQVEPTDTVLEVKQKLQTLIDKPPDNLLLQRHVKETGQYIPMDDAKKLADLKVENDDVVAMCYLREDGIGYEPVKISIPGADADTEAAAQQDAPAAQQEDTAKREEQR